MLHIYYPSLRQWRRCRCPKWLRGVLPNGETVQESAGTRSCEQAEDEEARLLEHSSRKKSRTLLIGTSASVLTVVRSSHPPVPPVSLRERE